MATNSEEDKASKTKKEGTSLLGAPSFTKLDNGRFKCVETGHEMLAKDKDSYSNSKRCRLGLIDFALSKNKPPLNIFKQDPLSRYQKVPISLSLSLSLSKSMLLFWAIELKAIIFLYFFLIQIEMGIG